MAYKGAVSRSRRSLSRNLVHQAQVFQLAAEVSRSRVACTLPSSSPVCTELNAGTGFVDILYVTPKGKLVLVEAKLRRKPEARRKLIAQILDYAKELNRWNYEELQNQVSVRTGQTGNVLYELVKEHFPDVEEADFVDEVSRTLRHGRFMLPIVGDGIQEGAGAIAQFLSDVGEHQFTLGLVEVGIYNMSRAEILVQPRILAKTVIIDRIVAELPDPGLQIRKSAEPAEGDSEENTFYSDFWEEFLQNLELNDVTQPIPKPGKREFVFQPAAEWYPSLDQCLFRWQCKKRLASIFDLERANSARSHIGNLNETRIRFWLSCQNPHSGA